MVINSEIEKKNFRNIPIIKKVKIIPHGVDIDKGFVIKKNSHKNLKFVFFSKIHKSKNLLTLVKLWQKSKFLKVLLIYLR